MEFTEQKLKKILQEQRLEYQRHLDVVIEVIKTTLELMSHQLKRKVDMDEFETLARRVLILERRRA